MITKNQTQDLKKEHKTIECSERSKQKKAKEMACLIKVLKYESKEGSLMIQIKKRVNYKKKQTI